MEGSMERYMIHYVSGNKYGVCRHEITDAIRSSKVAGEEVSFVENLELKPFIDNCLTFIQAGNTCWNGLGAYRYEGGAYYIGGRQVSETEVRLGLQIYYISYPQELEADKAYIEKRASGVKIQ